MNLLWICCGSVVRFFKCLFMMAEIDKFTAQLEQLLLVKRMDLTALGWDADAIHPLRKLLEGIIHNVNVI